MELKLSINKSIEQNAEKYFEQAKKFKKKIPGIVKTIELCKEQLERAEESSHSQQTAREPRQKKEWFEKFRWFISSDGLLVIGGRDATTNDIIVKKYLDKDDIIFHTELPGSPFVVIKNTEGNKDIPAQTIKEAAELCASFSKSWKSGRTTAEVYHISPEQVTKESPAGMAALPKGSFLITGKRNYHTPALNIAICNIGRIMAGPVSAIKKQCEDKNLRYVELMQGEDKLSDVGKKIQKTIGGELDEIIRSLPPECTIKKR